MVELEQLDDADRVTVRAMLEKHAEYTDSSLAKMMLIKWDRCQSCFVKVMPMDYKRVLQALAKAQAAGLSGDDALAAAFEENSHVGVH